MTSKCARLLRSGLPPSVRLLLPVAVCALASCSEPLIEPPHVSVPDPATVSALSNRIVDQQRELDQLRSLLANEREARAEQEAAARAARTTASGSAMTNNPMASILNAVGSVVSNPAVMDTVRRNFQDRGRARSRVYAELARAAGLEPERQAELERWVRQRRMASMAAGWVGEEESKRRADEADAQLKALLGSRYADFKSLDAELSVRSFVERFDLYLEGRGESLEQTRKTQLITALSASGVLVGEESLPSGGLSRAGGIAAMAEQEVDRSIQRYDRVVDVARPVLSSSENQALDAYLGEQLQQREWAADFTRRLMPAGGATNGDAGRR